MNKDIFEDKWKEIRNQSTQWWSLMSEFDLLKLDKDPAKYDRYVTMLQVKYGYTRDQARKELVKRVADYEAELKKNSRPA